MYSLIQLDEPELLSNTVLPQIKLSNIPEETPPDPIVAPVKPPIEVEPQPERFATLDIIDTGPIEGVIGGTYEPPKFTGEGGLPIDNQLVIAIGFPPEYPRRALERGIEGYAVVGFSVSAAGSVYDGHILESDPKGVFEKASLKAISKFKYKARKVNGRPVSTDGQRYMFTFKLDQ